MSQENVEIARRAMDALSEWNLMVGGADPLPVLQEFCDSEVEWDFSRRGVDPEIYHGYDGWLRIAEQFGDAWHELRFETQELIDAGDSVVIFSYMAGVAKSGISLGINVGQVWTFRDGKIIRDEYFGEDRTACLRAVGLEE